MRGRGGPPNPNHPMPPYHYNYHYGQAPKPKSTNNKNGTDSVEIKKKGPYARKTTAIKWTKEEVRILSSLNSYHLSFHNNRFAENSNLYYQNY
jgi:hypothetical protein